MRTLSLLIALLAGLLLASTAEAQDGETAPRRNRTVIGFGPSTVWSPTLKFEQGIGDWVSIGFHGKARFIIWEGGKIEPFVRVYFTEKSPEGPFIQLKGTFGAYRRNFVYSSNCYTDINGDYRCDDEDFFRSFGGGMAGGYQFFFGRRDHFALDLFGGFQYIYNQRREYYSEYNFLRRVFVNFPVEIGIRLGVAF